MFRTHNMSRNWSQDILAVLRGAQSVVNATLKLQEAQCKQVWENSSVKSTVVETSNLLDKSICKNLAEDSIQNVLSKNLLDAFERTSMLYAGVKEYISFAEGDEFSPKQTTRNEFSLDSSGLKREHMTKRTDTHMKSEQTSEAIQDDIKSLKFVDVTINKHLPEDVSSFSSKVASQVSESSQFYSSTEIQETNVVTPELTVESIGTPKSIVDYTYVSSPKHALDTTLSSDERTTKVKLKAKQKLSETAKQRKVPSSRIARMVSFGGLAAGLGIGTVAEVTRRSLGLKIEEPSVGRALDSVFLSEANAERIVNTLCKVRGAALKLGQILSIQDNTIISPTLQKAFERVRQSADFMPTWQVEKVLQSEFGDNWRSEVAMFEPKPFAAASIGQVHLAVLPDGKEVAMKIQYPGVAKGIESDIDNLVGILKVWNVFPKSLFIDNLVEVAKRELAWEVDYLREMECTKKFKNLLKIYPNYYIPNVIDNLSTKQVFTTELIEGIPVDKCVDLDLETRQHIGKLIMELCLKEIFEFCYMQTDPNWSNFFYNPETRQLILLDFGASRPYSKDFIDIYIQIIRGAADGDREKVLQVSRDIGFLTGYESKTMEEAHIDAVMILGEVFRRSSEPFDFGSQDTTRRIQHLVPTMLKHRLCPPPEEIYSLHRKLSGVFLLLAKLNIKIECKSMFENVYQSYYKKS